MNVWLGITALAVFGIFAPSIFGIDGFDGGFAISFVSFFMVIVGIVVVLMYRGRAKALDGILKGQDVLAHFRYNPADWQEYAEKDYRMEREAKWGLYRLVMIITAVVTFGFWLFHTDAGVLMLGIFFGLGLLLAGVIQFTTGYDRWQNRRHQGEAVIARSGAFVGRKLHLWRGWGATLDGLNYDERQRLLEITYSMPSRTGRDSATVRVAVPPGQEAKARQVLQELAAGR
jgi:hypothetical protein